MESRLEDRYIRFDWAIKQLLRQKANFGVLEGFLTVFLNEKITILEILESEGNQQTADDIFSRVDIKARNSQDEIIIIEIQNTRELNYLKHILYGVAKAITKHISLGETYYHVKKIYSISILYFDIGNGNDYLYYGQNHFVGVHTGDELQVNVKEKNAFTTRKPADIFPKHVLIRVNEFNQIATTPLEEWMNYLKSGVIRPDTTAPGLGEAREKLKYNSMNPKERHAYDEHLNSVMMQNDVLDSAKLEGLIEGRQEGLKKGLEEGLEAGRQEGLEAGRREGREAGRQEGLEAGRQEGLEAGRREGREAGQQEAHEAGRQKGHEAGKQEGLVSGFEIGRQEGLNEGRKAGLEAGREEGSEEANKMNALKMKSLGIPSRLIHLATALTIAEIEEL